MSHFGRDLFIRCLQIDALSSQLWSFSLYFSFFASSVPVHSFARAVPEPSAVSRVCRLLSPTVLTKPAASLINKLPQLICGVSVKLPQW